MTTKIGGHFIENDGTYFGAVVALENASDFSDSFDLRPPQPYHFRFHWLYFDSFLGDGLYSCISPEGSSLHRPKLLRTFTPTRRRFGPFRPPVEAMPQKLNRDASFENFQNR